MNEAYTIDGAFHFSMPKNTSHNHCYNNAIREAQTPYFVDIKNAILKDLIPDFLDIILITLTGSSHQ